MKPCFSRRAETSRGFSVGTLPTTQPGSSGLRQPPAIEVDRTALDAVRKLGMETKEVTLPDWPYVSLNTILFAEAAAAFEELTTTRGVDHSISPRWTSSRPTASAGWWPARWPTSSTPWTF
jgi:hypothetical protein